MVKGSMWRNLGCSQQPSLLSNELFSCSPTDNPLSLNSETLGLPKLQSVLSTAGRRVCVIPQGKTIFPPLQRGGNSWLALKILEKQRTESRRDKTVSSIYTDWDGELAG